MCFRRCLLENYDDVWFENYAHDCLLWGKAVLSETAYIYNEDTIEFRRHDKNASSRGGGSLKYRLEGLNTEIDIISRMLLFCKKDIRHKATNDALGELIAGNTGFQQEVPNYLVVTADVSAFYDTFERNQVYVEAGLFSMALVEALHYYGIGS